LQALWACDRAEGANITIAAIAREHAVADTTQSAQPDPLAAGAYREQYGRFLDHLDATKQFHARRRDPSTGSSST
jgi:xylulokinase